MNTFKEELIKEIKSKRPKLSENSIKTYVSSLISINKKLNGDKTIDWFDEQAKEIIDYLEKMNAKTSKTILSAIFVLTGNKEIHNKMISLSNEVTKKQISKAVIGYQVKRLKRFIKIIITKP